MSSFREVHCGPGFLPYKGVIFAYAKLPPFSLLAPPCSFSNMKTSQEPSPTLSSTGKIFLLMHRAKQFSKKKFALVPVLMRVRCNAPGTLGTEDALAPLQHPYPDISEDFRDFRTSVIRLPGFKVFVTKNSSLRSGNKGDGR